MCMWKIRKRSKPHTRLTQKGIGMTRTRRQVHFRVSWQKPVSKTRGGLEDTSPSEADGNLERALVFLKPGNGAQINLL